MIDNKLEKAIQLLENNVFDPNNKSRIKALFDFLRKSQTFEKELTLIKSADSVQYYTRAANCIAFLWDSEEVIINREEYVRLIPYVNQINYIFFLSGFETPEVLINRIRSRAINKQGNQLNFANENLAHKYLLLTGPFSSQHTLDLSEMFKRQPHGVFSLLLQHLSLRLYAFEKVFKNQQELINALSQTVNVNPNVNNVLNIHLLWAISSYWDEDLNVKVKTSLNTILEDTFTKAKVSTEPVNRHIKLEKNTKPKLMIVAEALNKEHVMFRCFGPSLIKLKENFELIVITAKEDLGEKEWDWVDDLYTFSVREFALNIQKDRIQKIAPDIILYPSIGMKLWTILMSRFRLAPLQISMLGHPDFHYSNNIDYLIGGKGLFSEKYANDENIVPFSGSSGSLFDISNINLFNSHSPGIKSGDSLSDKENFEDPNSKKPISALKVIICANIFKFNYHFGQVLKKIKEQSDCPFEFHILQNLTGLHFQIGKKQIKRILGEERVFVYPRLVFRDYVSLLKSGDIYLSPFPFGGENSTLDALLAGLPVIAKTGSTPRELLDYRVLKQAGLEIEYCHETDEQYINHALQLINSPELLEAAKKKIKPETIAQIFKKETESNAGELNQVITTLYQKHLERS